MKITYEDLLGRCQLFDINLNEYWKTSCQDNKPETIQKALGDLPVLTFGGYGENRSDIWKGTYLDKEQKYIHLGVDLNVPVGTRVYAPFDCVGRMFYKDLDTEIGWGGQLIISKDYETDYPLLVFGHLNPDSINTNRYHKKGDLLGKVGTWPTNGNVFEHLHIQSYIGRGNVAKLDGYGTIEDLKASPNPFEVEW